MSSYYDVSFVPDGVSSLVRPIRCTHDLPSAIECATEDHGRPLVTEDGITYGLKGVIARGNAGFYCISEGPEDVEIATPAPRKKVTKKRGPRVVPKFPITSEDKEIADAMRERAVARRYSNQSLPGEMVHA